MTFGLTLDTYKRGFFDRQAVSDPARASMTRGLSKIGAFIRTDARGSIRRGKKISAPGEPPTAHVAEDGIKQILFTFDASSQSVITGAVKLNGKTYGNVPVPELLEVGGDTVAVVKQKPQRLHYNPHPFMKPAYERQTKNEKLRSVLENCIQP
jgi:hypothetical protein